MSMTCAIANSLFSELNIGELSGRLVVATHHDRQAGLIAEPLEHIVPGLVADLELHRFACPISPLICGRFLGVRCPGTARFVAHLASHKVAFLERAESRPVGEPAKGAVLLGCQDLNLAQVFRIGLKTINLKLAARFYAGVDADRDR